MSLIYMRIAGLKKSEIFFAKIALKKLIFYTKKAHILHRAPYTAFMWVFIILIIDQEQHRVSDSDVRQMLIKISTTILPFPMMAIKLERRVHKACTSQQALRGKSGVPLRYICEPSFLLDKPHMQSRRLGVSQISFRWDVPVTCRNLARRSCQFMI